MGIRVYVFVTYNDGLKSVRAIYEAASPIDTSEAFIQWLEHMGHILPGEEYKIEESR